MAFEIMTPREIEEKSMATIVSELNGRTWPEPEFSIVAMLFSSISRGVIISKAIFSHILYR